MAKRKISKKTPKKRAAKKSVSTKKKSASKKTKKKATTKKAAAAKASSERTKSPKTAKVKVEKTPPPAEIEPKPPRKRKRKPMSPSDKKKHRDILLSLSDKITGRIKFLSKTSLNKEGYDVPLDTGTEDFERDFALTLLSSEQDVVFEIEQALRRLEEGTYGICEACDKKILQNRMKAVPFARMCISCQSEAEKTRPAFRPFGQTLMANEPKSGASRHRSGSSSE